MFRTGIVPPDTNGHLGTFHREAPSNPKTFVSPFDSFRNCRQAAKDRRDGTRQKAATLKEDGIRREKGYL